MTPASQNRKVSAAGKEGKKASTRKRRLPPDEPAARAVHAHSVRRGQPARQQPQAARNPHAGLEKARAANPRRRVTLSLLALAALVITGAVLAGPVMRNVEASREIRAKQAELEREKAATADLENRKAEANDAGFLEKEARRIGYVLPGEIPVVVVEEAAQAEEPSGEAASVSEDPASRP